MTAQPTLGPRPLVRRSRPVSRGTVLIVGVILIPIALNVALNSYGALTVDGAIRMAFATVAGQTVAVISALAALVLTVERRYAWPAVMAFGIIATLISAAALLTIATAGETLLDRLDMIAEVDELNR